MPPVLAQADDKGLIEQTPGVEVQEQGGERGIEPREELVPHQRDVLGVRVPAGDGQPVLVPEDRDESASRLDQAASRQCGLAEQRHAVRLTG